MRRVALLSACAAAAAVAGLSAWAYFRPLDAHDLALRARLWVGGVRRAKLGELEALVRDSCGRGQECRCAALIHGLGDSAETWSEILLDAPAAPFPKGVRAYAVDLPGTGGSKPPLGPEGYGVRALAGSVRASLEQARPVCSKWTVAGNSLGGWIAAWLALDWPQGVGKLVLLSSAGLNDPSGISERTARTLADPDPGNLKEFIRKASFRPGAVPERALAQLAERLRKRPTRAMVLALREEDFLESRLAGIKPRTVILWGDADGLIPPSQGEKLHAGIPASSFELVARCGHLPQKECPDRVRQAVLGP